MKKLNISILGCGWLGLPLLKSLVTDGHTVKGSSRNPETLAEIRRTGAEAFEIDLPQALPSRFTDKCDILIFTLPPGGRKYGAAAKDHYLKSLESLSAWLSSPDAPRVIYTSSTGVYGNQTGLVTEETSPHPVTHSSRAVRLAEEWFSAMRCPLTILRLAGLVSADRHPGNFYGGKDRPIPEANAPVNLVHQKDVIAAIKCCLNSDQPFTIYNVCAAAHPTKGDFYAAAAISLGLAVKGAEPGGKESKILNSDRLRALGWAPVWDELDLSFFQNETSLRPFSNPSVTRPYSTLNMANKQH